MKTCQKCGGVFLNTTDFFYRKKQNQDGLTRDCRSCVKSRMKRWYCYSSGRVKERNKAWVLANPEKSAATYFRIKLRKKYGMTQDQYDSLYRKQNGLCAICLSVPKPWPCIDHSHSTKVVRGILCFSCNTALGHFKDDPELLRSATKYLERFETRNSVTETNRVNFQALLA